MKKLLFIALFSFSIHAFSEWEVITSDEDYLSMHYVDTDNIRESDGYIFYWKLVNYLEPQKFQLGEYKSVLQQKQADCKLFRVKTNQTTLYPHMFAEMINENIQCSS